MNILEQGYWLYSDGFTAWGIAMVRNGESPIKVDKKTHELPVEERVAHFVKTVEETTKKKEADAKAEAAAEKAKPAVKKA